MYAQTDEHKGWNSDANVWTFIFSLFFVGNDIVHQFEKCPTPFCSEKIIDIEAPMPQLVLLLEKSPMCKQEITFNCFLAPIMVRIFFSNSISGTVR